MNSSPMLAKVISLLADNLYKKGKIIEAAEAYVDSDKNFETICLKLVDNKSALKKFLESQLKIMGSDKKTQRTLITI